MWDPTVKEQTKKTALNLEPFKIQSLSLPNASIEPNITSNVNYTTEELKFPDY